MTAHPAHASGTIGDTGEFDLIERIVAPAAQGPAVGLGPGDDAAVVRLAGPDLVITTDVLVEGVHFRRTWSQAADIGRKTVAVNVADVEAMGARPVGVVVALAAPADLPTSWLDELADGIRTECTTAGVSLVGGDLSAAPQVVLTATAFGDLDGRAPVTRTGARPGDVVAIRGRLGWAAAGLAALGRGFRSPRAAVEAQRVPQVPYGAGALAAAAGASAMIDVSDGLLADVGHIAAGSGVVCDLRSEAFPVPDPVAAVASATGADPLALILCGGEDHALAATFAAGDVPKDWWVVGEVRTGEPGVLVDGAAWEGEAGFRHFGH